MKKDSGGEPCLVFVKFQGWWQTTEGQYVEVKDDVVKYLPGSEEYTPRYLPPNSMQLPDYPMRLQDGSLGKGDMSPRGQLITWNDGDEWEKVVRPTDTYRSSRIPRSSRQGSEFHLRSIFSP